MHAHHEFAEHLRELLAGVGAVRLRPMFGGLGVYLDDCMFGLIMDETLYLKTDPASVDAFRDAGGEPFVYRPVRDGHVPGYWTPPAEALESAAAMRPWAQRALEAARRRPARRR
ncbi:TfoX/Sxy family protein [Pseudoxanthomonas beigongshangi]|uniref:TfoX/Sxy family protein n=1 Tax=Pseudoxanthomonas beigongshangi TaxID=2782537 RepID=UPI00193B58D2|nr:TfoX/Sxy family protein [Pseudoxanthomonas beigongshangi]